MSRNVRNFDPKSILETEYRGVANAVAEAIWLHNLLLELQCPLSRATVVFCDNVSVVYLASNRVQQQRTKHVEIIYSLFEREVPLVKYVFSMFPQPISSSCSLKKLQNKSSLK